MNYFIGVYYAVYNHTARTYPEYIYERAMIKELRQAGLTASPFSPLS